MTNSTYIVTDSTEFVIYTTVPDILPFFQAYLQTREMRSQSGSFRLLANTNITAMLKGIVVPA